MKLGRSIPGPIGGGSANDGTNSSRSRLDQCSPTLGAGSPRRATGALDDFSNLLASKRARMRETRIRYGLLFWAIRSQSCCQLPAASFAQQQARCAALMAMIFVHQCFY